MGQQVRIEETIAAMKRALNRRDSTSESDDSIQRATNRGNKLKRKARFVQQGHLDLAAGSRSYKRRIDYNGYVRHVISRNPPMVDLDGDVIEDEEGNSSAGELSPAEDNPYRDTKLEQILKPLTRASELKDHPALSIYYRSQILEEMIQNAQEMVHRESGALWRMKQLLTGFRGDEDWAPCGSFITDNDILLLRGSKTNTSGPPSIASEAEPGLDEHTTAVIEALPAPTDAVDFAQIERSTEGGQTEQTKSTNHEVHDPNNQLKTELAEQQRLEKKARPVLAVGAEPALAVETEAKATEPNGKINGDNQEELTSTDETVPPESTSTVATDTAGDASMPGVEPSIKITETETATSHPGDEEVDEEPQPHRMTTRARAQAEQPDADDGSNLEATGLANAIHPFFLVPPSAIPDKNSGIAAELADETRRLLCAYVQKQEEICRGVQELHSGLLRALRLKKQVLEWSTAEAHIGEMSDGEDWYDKERWGLEDDLKKGEEVEDDDVNTTGKKTRNRRAAA